MSSWTEVAHLIEGSLSGRRLLTFREFWQDHRSRNTTVCRGSAVILVGMVEEVLNETVKIRPMCFEPWQGFIPQECNSLQAVIPDLRNRAIKLNIGGDILLYGSSTSAGDPSVMTFSKDVLVLHRSKFEAQLPYNLLHLFSGSYCGWSRAMEWYSDCSGLPNLPRRGLNGAGCLVSATQPELLLWQDRSSGKMGSIRDHWRLFRCR